MILGTLTRMTDNGPEPLTSESLLFDLKEAERTMFFRLQDAHDGDGQAVVDEADIDFTRDVLASALDAIKLLTA